MSIKVIYTECSSFYWKDVAINLQQELGWEPCYWTAAPDYVKSDPTFESVIKSAFPDVVFHDNYDALNGIPPDEYKDLPLKPVDHQTVKDLSPDILSTLKMMDRMDPLFIFNLKDREQLLNYYISYWTNILDVLKPDVFLAPCTPHLMYDFVLYHLCLQRGIRTVLFAPLAKFNDFFAFVVDKYDQVPEYIEKTYLQEKLHESINLSSKGESYLKSLSGEYDQGIPEYVAEIYDQDSKKKKWFEKVSHLVFRVFYLNRYKLYLNHISKLFFGYTRNYIFHGKPLGSRLSGWRHTKFLRRLKGKTKMLKEYYHSSTQAIDLSLKFVYIPLGFESERTNCPEGGAFSDQFLMVEMVSKCIPDGWMVYVREHPAQFIFDTFQTRRSSLYDKINELNNAKLVDLSQDPYELIDKSSTLALLSGTTGWEALVRGNPVLVFGYPWYQACEGAFNIRSESDCQSALDEIVNGYKVNYKNISAYFSTMEKCCAYQYYQNVLTREQFERNVASISHLLKKWFLNELEDIDFSKQLEGQ